jgi:hypothetical protein
VWLVEDRMRHRLSHALMPSARYHDVTTSRRRCGRANYEEMDQPAAAGPHAKAAYRINGRRTSASA